MTQEAKLAARERALAELLGRTGLPHAPLAMPKQVLEPHSRWLFAIYARLVRRV